ncbi:MULTISPECIES: redoxin domain-containing protein [unclassified Duganella]|uniref:SCO family protein n=1 Tax=unclassified Duganella TaxID=2636909 RepID=UPI000E34F391|nr:MULTISPECIES: redoxin domain-containing protein [unclassified Duganella]RFP10780.1 cytochrome C oxidase subunit I [Duganella sp. BJB475]RFP27192.1 cytochrome C oxidase subunit I [Duganella sp. BJB476]
MENKSNQGRGRWKLLLVLAVCAAPLVGSYLTYYVIKPKGGVTNFGALIDPRDHPIPAMASTTLDGKPATLENYKGKWIMLKVGPSDCKQDCQDQLFAMRQLRTMQGKEMERIERVWMITDDQPLDTLLMRVNDGTRMLRAPAAVIDKWLPLEQGAGDRVSDHVYLIDPLGNLMMRFPKGAVSSDTEKVKKVHKDISKLLKASAIG